MFRSVARLDVRKRRSLYCVMLRFRTFAGTLVALAIVTGTLTAPADPGRSVQAQARERQLYVSVLDATGAPVAGLGPDDFTVREDGVAREVLRVSRAEAPIQIAVLIDNSQAASSFVADFRQGLTAFVEALHGRNEIALITLADRPTILREATSDLPPLKDAIGRIFGVPGSGTYLLDGLMEAARGLRKREATRPVIVALVTEGIEYSTLHYEQVLGPLRDGGIAFHALVLAEGDDGGLLRDETQNRNVVLGRGPAETGGRREQLLTSMAAPVKLKELAAELANQYLVVYARPDSLIPPRTVQVSARRPELTARGTPVRTGRGS